MAQVELCERIEDGNISIMHFTNGEEVCLNDTVLELFDQDGQVKYSAEFLTNREGRKAQAFLLYSITNTTLELVHG